MKCLSESDGSFDRSRARSSDHEVIVLDDTVMLPSAHWVNSFLCQIFIRLTTLMVDLRLFSIFPLRVYLVNLLVEFCSVVVSVLANTGNGVRDTGWMPCSNTGNLTETSVSLSWQSGDTPSGHNTLRSSSLGHSNSVTHVIVAEDS